jgi:hypothetical protein
MAFPVHVNQKSPQLISAKGLSARQFACERRYYAGSPMARQQQHTKQAVKRVACVDEVVGAMVMDLFKVALF